MDKKNPGHFSQAFLSLQLQIRTLLEGSGGNLTIEFLDSLSQLGKKEQEIIIKSFQKVVERLAQSSNRLVSDADKEAKAFEDALYQDIVKAMTEAGALKEVKGKRLEVLQGGRNIRRRVSSPIIKTKRLQNSHLKPVLN